MSKDINQHVQSNLIHNLSRKRGRKKELKMMLTCDKELFGECATIKGSNFLLQDDNKDPGEKKRMFF